MRKQIAVFTVFFLLVTCSSPVSNEKQPVNESANRNVDALVLIDTFESGELNDLWNTEFCCDYSLQISDSVARTGNRSLRAELRKSDSPVAEGGMRAELLFTAVPQFAERWYGFSVYLPEDYEIDPTFELIAQWHGVPDFSLDEPWRSPPLHLATKNGRWEISRKWDSRQVQPENDYEGTEQIDLGEYERGMWTDWVVHVRWSYLENGVLEIWKDGELVIERVGPNTFNDMFGPYFKTGMYKSPYENTPELATTEVRVVFIDEVRLGSENATYKDVKPGD